MANPSRSDELQSLHKRAAEICANTVSARSRAVYRNSYARFVVWLLAVRSPILHASFVRRVVELAPNEARPTGQTGEPISLLFDRLPIDEKIARAAVLEALDGDISQPPFKFDKLDAEDFVAWLLTLRTVTGAQLSYSALNTHRAGLFNLFRVYNEVMPKKLERRLSDHFKGLKRSIAEETAAGSGHAMKVGKDPLQYDLYKFICSEMLSDLSLDMVFSRTYMIIAWNLMCRSANAFGIMMDHMEWRDDALCIYFSHMKNDQAGDRPRDPRHVYANPLEPAVCPILALGIYWSVFTFDSSNSKLFPGGSQYDRFRKELGRVLIMDNVAEELKRRGVKPNDIGTHSLRKGAATFAASGSTACPSSTAVNLRAGWSLGGVQNTYLRYEGAGDMHVGRTVTGLPADSHTFACLPPHFECLDDVVEQALSIVFPGAPTNIRYILEFALASLVYHQKFLTTTLPPSHVLLRTPLFSTRSMLTDLAGKILGGTLQRECTLRATGVPPHVSILANMASLQQSAVRTLAKIDSSRTDVVKDIVGELERRAIGAGTVTYDGLNDMIMRCLDSAGVTSIVNHLQVADQPVPPTTTGEQQSDLQQWSNHFNSIPSSYSIPECTVYQAWMLWQCGAPSTNIPPLRLVEPSQLANKNAKKRLSDFAFLNKAIERQAADRGMKNTNLSAQEAEEVFRECCEAITLPTTTAKGRKRRRGQLLWRSVVNELRAARRRRG